MHSTDSKGDAVLTKSYTFPIKKYKINNKIFPRKENLQQIN